MAESFDPYHKWLAIPQEDQPPSHYRLLAIESGEQDEEVISNAADQRISHLKILEMGEHGETATALISEIEEARDCLLDPEKRSTYESRCEEDSSIAAVDTPFTIDSNPAPAEGVFTDSLNQTTADKKTDPSRSKKSKAANKKAKRISVIGHILAPLIGLALGGIVLFVIKSMPSEKEDPSQIDFEMGSMRQSDGQDQESPEAGAEPDAEGGEAAPDVDASGGEPLGDERNVVETINEINDQEQSSGEMEGIAGGAVASDEDLITESDRTEEKNREDDQAEVASEAVSPRGGNTDQVFGTSDPSSAEGPVVNEQVDSIDVQLREQKEALVAAIDDGNLMLQLELAVTIATLEDVDHWERQVELFENYKEVGARADNQAIIKASILLSQQAADRGLEKKARMLAIEALSAARSEGSPSLVRKVTAYILQLSSAESE